MDKQLQIFKNEEFGQVRALVVNGEPYFVGKDVAKILGYTTLQRMYDHVEKEDKKKIDPQSAEFAGLCENGTTLESNPNVRTLMIINESGLYDAIFGSTLPNAKKFKRWVTSEVLPSIRKHGAYMTQDTIEKAINDPDFLIQLATKLKEEKEARIKAENEVKEKQTEIEHKKEVITGLTANITTAEKRQLINKVVRYKTSEYQRRWTELYSQFELKYHCNLEKRLASYNKSNSPKMKSKVDYIDRVMNMIPELYELTCKLYENDVNSLIKELFYIL